MPLEHRDERETVEAKRGDRGAADGRAPDTPTDLSTTKMGTLKRTFKEFSADDLTDWAAALTYYAVLAIFPALIALVWCRSSAWSAIRLRSRCWPTLARSRRGRPRTS